MATKAVTHYAISIRLACRIFKVSESCYRYQPVLVDENQEIADWLLRITASQRNWGFGLCFLLHIPADHEHRFRFNVNTISGPM
ncbi:hypothetical protein WP2S18C03_24580 [Aeromonas veronii]|nr:hypothetical protein WP2S18C03_24580 [Aeromonas veronii]